MISILAGPVSCRADTTTESLPQPVLGFYSVPADACSLLAAHGFTVVQNYRFESHWSDPKAYAREARAYLDEAHKHGLRVLMGAPRNWLTERREDLLREAVRALRGHDAILAWYEDERGQEGDVGAVEFLDRIVREEDPRHGVIIEEGRDLERLRSLGRVRMFTYYPVTHEARRAGRLRTLKQRFPVDVLDRPFWPVLQAFGRDLIAGYPKKNFVAPSLQELEYTLASALIAGARGIFLYTYRLSTVYDTARAAKGQFAFADPKPLAEVSPQLWEDALTVGLQARLLLERLEDAQPAHEVRILDADAKEIELGAWHVGQELWVLVANSTYTAGQVALSTSTSHTQFERLHRTQWGPGQPVTGSGIRVSIAGPGAIILRLTHTSNDGARRR